LLSTLAESLLSVTNFAGQEYSITDLIKLSTDHLANVIKAGLLPTFIIDPSGRIVLWNRGMTKLMTTEESGVIGHLYDELPGDWPDLLLETAAAPTFESIVDVVIDGKQQELMLNAYRVRLEKFGSACIVHLHDLSQRKRHTDRHIHQQRMESLGRLAGGIAHDFNNILTIIRGNALVLRNDEDINQSQRGVSQSIIKATQKGAAMINRLLTFSKPQPFTPYPVDLANLIDETLSLVSHADWEKIEVVSEMEPDLPAIQGEPNRLSQVLVNLFVNARDAMPEGGKLIVRVQRHHFLTPSELPQAGVVPGTYIAVEVIDSGIGMPKDVIDRIFEPFFTTKSTGKGTGLGLPNVHSIVKQHSGWIEVESTPGEGSNFTVFLPAIRD
jgi:two-component system, cell cycle sensor histidine kinase and response regulator CckA